MTLWCATTTATQDPEPGFNAVLLEILNNFIFKFVFF